MATGAPKPAMPSIRAPKLKATMRAWMRRSSVNRPRERRITSKSPLATVRLWKKTAFSTTQLMGHRPKAMPWAVAAAVRSTGIPQTSQASVTAETTATSADFQAATRSTASSTKSRTSGANATNADATALPATGW